MKLFAPKNEGVNWDVRRADSGWGYIGSIPTISGKRVSEETALTFSAVFAATRVISETIASLPLNTFEQKDERTQHKAYKHPLWSILHDVPNPEQDIMCFLDMQVALQVNWGNAYAEIQRDASGNVIALWPIHPSRIPVSNITRNPTSLYGRMQIEAGQPGELVYWVRNDDQSYTPIPASDMLHVPGVLSTNGITGQGIVRWAANSIGIALAVDEHAGALFRNGAVTNMVIKSPKVVGKETAERLRTQWQSMFGGVQNHYKTLLLEEGMEPVPVTMNAQDSQLLLSRQFSVTEIARWYRLPPHLLADLSRSSFSNIEEENISFVTHSMQPWVSRWEKALYRQLLTEEEKRRFLFKFNMNGLLRGNHVARSQFYQAMFQLGAFSPNDIRGYEDLNPIPGGDQYFVPGNNYVPLDKINELVQANIDKRKAPPPTPSAPAQNDMNALQRRLKVLRRLQEKLIALVEEDGRRVATKEDVLRAVVETRAECGVDFGAAFEGFSQNLSTTLEKHNEAERDAMLRAVDNQLQQTREGVSQKLDETIETLKNTQNEAFSAQKEAIFEKIDDFMPEPAVSDTSAIEAVAVREAALAAEREAMDTRLAEERQTTQRVLTIALKRIVGEMLDIESKAVNAAGGKPHEWQSWRNGYYKRFRKLFEAELESVSADFEACGVILNIPWAVDRYAASSIRDLKAIDAIAGDSSRHDQMRPAVDSLIKSQWLDRPAALAVEILERGKRLFEERDTK